MTMPMTRNFQSHILRPISFACNTNVALIELKALLKIQTPGHSGILADLKAWHHTYYVNFPQLTQHQEFQPTTKNCKKIDEMIRNGTSELKGQTFGLHVQNYIS